MRPLIALACLSALALPLALPVSLAPFAPAPTNPPRTPDPQPAPRGEPKDIPTVLTGRITDAEGNPVPDVKVQLYSGFATRFAGQHTQTGPDGVYRFDPLQTGAVIAHTEPAFYTGLRLEHPHLVSADGANWWDLHIPRGDTAHRDFTLIPGGRVTGDVTDHRGYRWGDFHIRIVPADEDSKIGAYYAATDHKGRFEIPDAIYPGRYEVQWNEPHANFTILATINVAPRTTTHLLIPLRLTAEPQEISIEVKNTADGD